jgi:hypothetical protein
MPFAPDGSSARITREAATKEHLTSYQAKRPLDIMAYAARTGAL